ncbi:MAG: mechanosensitive ion channel [Bacteroidales bacterium]
MNVIYKFIPGLILALFLSATTLQAQIIESVEKIWNNEKSATETADAKADSIRKVESTRKADSLRFADSLRLVDYTRQLQEMKMNEILLRNELEKTKKGNKITDSIRIARQKQQIDSLKKVVRGVPVVIEGDTLFLLFAKRGGLSPEHRAENSVNAINKIGRKFNVNPDSVYLFKSEIATDIMYQDIVILSITAVDGLWQNSTSDTLAAQYKPVIISAIKKVNQEHGVLMLTLRIVALLLLIAAQYVLIRLTLKLYGYAKLKIKELLNTKLKGLKIRDYQFMTANREAELLLYVAKLGKYLLIALQLLVSLPLLFLIFPATKHLAGLFAGYLFAPFKKVVISVVDYTPNLFTIVVIYVCIRYTVKGIRFLANEIAEERIKIGSFYPDWAMPTFHIVRSLLYIFMLVLIYPYLPASDSGVFKGISVFVGIIISIGSSTVIGNIIAGMVITYMRPFKIGDRINLNDTTGNVIEKTPFVTRIRTPKNEIITIPNSFIMSNQTTNYTTSAQNYGLILHSNVTIGYDTEWRDVHRLLIEAALATPGIKKEPQPFVLELGLSDFYPVYQINAYIGEEQVNKMATIYSNLHQNIQDKFNEAGIQIMSPNYEADTEEPAIPVRYRKSQKDSGS